MRSAFPFLPGCCAVLLATLSVSGDEPAQQPFDPGPVATLLELVIDADADSAKKCLGVLAEKSQSGEITGDQLTALQDRLNETVASILKRPDDPLFADAVLLAATWNQPGGIEAGRGILSDVALASDLRLRALHALAAAGDVGVLEISAKVLAEPESNSREFRAALIQALGRMEDPQVAETVIAAYERLEDELKPAAIELLTQRVAWSKRLLAEIGEGEIPADAVNVNQIRKLLASRDDELRKLVIAKWGSVRTERNPQREQIIADMRSLIRDTPGDARRGQLVFNKLCGQCHKIYGEGQEVGPDITSNGRASFEQLLSNVFDPSLVIGASYQARQLITLDGRVLAGLLVEDSDARVVLKMQGGKIETIPRDDIDEIQVSKLSLMPEGLEKQLAAKDIADLFEFLTLDKPPSDPSAAYIPGTSE